jgi:membrane protein DedA with SNARE-associated domain
MTEWLLAWLGSAPTLPAYALLIVLSALENVFPPVPADVAVALGAFFAQRAGHSVVLLGLLCWLANTASSIGMYALARARGPAFFAKGLGHKLLPAAALDALRDAYDRHGVAGIFFSRFLPGVRAGVTPFAGVVGLSPARTLVPAAAASAIWYAALVSVASAFGLEWSAVRGLLARADATLTGLAAAAAAVLVLWLVHRVRRRRA